MHRFCKRIMGVQRPPQAPQLNINGALGVKGGLRPPSIFKAIPKLPPYYMQQILKEERYNCDGAKMYNIQSIKPDYLQLMKNNTHNRRRKEWSNIKHTLWINGIINGQTFNKFQFQYNKIFRQSSFTTLPSLDLVINSIGGYSEEMCKILFILNHHVGYKTAYINNKALSAAAMIALYCDKIVMTNYNSVLGKKKGSTSL